MVSNCRLGFINNIEILEVYILPGFSHFSDDFDTESIISRSQVVITFGVIAQQSSVFEHEDIGVGGCCRRRRANGDSIKGGLCSVDERYPGGLVILVHGVCIQGIAVTDSFVLQISPVTIDVGPVHDGGFGVILDILISLSVPFGYFIRISAGI